MLDVLYIIFDTYKEFIYIIMWVLLLTAMYEVATS